MVRDTSTRLERATGELGDLLVRAKLHLTHGSIMTVRGELLRHPSSGMQKWSRTWTYAKRRPSWQEPIALDG